MTTSAEQSTDGRVLRARALREERRAQLLSAALRVFAQKGYHDASIHDIVQTAGVARGTFYLYFESKRAIFEELLDDMLEEVRATIRGVELGSPDPPEVQLRATLVSVLELLVENEDMTIILLRQAVGLDEDFDRKLTEFYDRLAEIIQVALTIGHQMGLVRAVSPAIVARCILGGVKEVLSAELLQAGEAPPNLELLARHIVDYNLVGVLAR